MNRAKKAEVIGALAERLKGSPNLYVTDFTGVAVKPMTELRRKLRSAGVEYVVVKNTLALRALKAASVAGLEQVIQGPTGLVFAGADPAAAAQVLAEFHKEYQKLTVKAGLVEGRAVTAEDVQRLATLPPREELLVWLGGALEAPLQGFAGVLTSLFYEFVAAVEALRAGRANA